MTEYIVEGRRFQIHLHAITFAQAQSLGMGRPVHVKSETTVLGKTTRTWMATMYPPNTKYTLLSQQRVMQVA